MGAAIRTEETTLSGDGELSEQQLYAKTANRAQEDFLTKVEGRAGRTMQLHLLRERSREPRDFNDLFHKVNDEPRFNDGHDFGHANDRAAIGLSEAAPTQELEEMGTQVLANGRWRQIFEKPNNPIFFDGHDFSHDVDEKSIHPDNHWKAAPVKLFRRKAHDSPYFHGHNAFHGGELGIP